MSKKYHSTVSRRDFLKILGLGGLGLGASAVAAPVIHDLDEMIASPEADFKRPWYVKEVDKLGIPEGPILGQLQRGKDIEWEGKIIHIDPSSRADYSKLPKADMILITHTHFDHFDPKAYNIIKKESTIFVGTENCAQKVSDMKIMKNGDIKTINGIKIEAVPAYN